MKRCFVIGSLVLGGGFAIAAPTPAGSKASFALPSGAKLVSAAQLDDMSAFPGLNKSNKTATEDIVDIARSDRVYELKQGYKQAVGYFDAMVKKGSATQLERTSTRTMTGWALQLPDGTMQTVLVRNTQPTTIETVQAADTVETGALDAISNAKPMSGHSKRKDANKTTSANSPAGDPLPANDATLETKEQDNR